MPTYAFDWVDAFTSQPFGGNACVVVHEAADLGIEDRLALVRETSLSECAYIVPSEKADFGARYYLATREIPMAGHPTIATVASLLHRGLVPLKAGRAEFTLEVGAGVLPITVEGDLITMQQSAPLFGAPQDPAEIAAMYGLPTDAILGTPRIVSTGTPFCCTVLRDRPSLDAAKLDVARLEAWRSRQGEQAALMEPFLTVLEGADEGDIFSRLLLAPPMPAEDPFTGSANGCMAAYLWAEGLIDDPVYKADQGHGMGRPGQAHIEVLGPRDAINGIRVGGRGRVLMSGSLDL
ncbi:PhzF family phenazine biosynthesis protein [Algicella marina]|uniref:PhzF family phenazine biosynthesis isomerase n=1 Tax=Algicella marina TaxID=2683284 RepID=A0A6P1SUX6_9RHOB|nr:PhzF family phenazine biosynthesis protein [Algicella marina]QHQ34494.1 PhzF family phenazine biosynthesis isomerase [Algicella marina]